ncbi:TIGR00270 family protein [Candidatus Bathyarchaeota archaeon]|nr:TIGR00270 family protein [Candidatus Bathyarchaeota archaeon]MBS7637069.1 TIGR00270 family protein [Candidatus Bathyarchaeota archaeon]
MRCEVCGRKIHGKPLRALIEGAKLTVCGECSKHGTIIWEEKVKQTPTPKIKPKTAPPQTLKAQTTERAQAVFESPLDLVDDYDVRVRQAREKLGLTHEELGKKINEKVSVLKKIETKKIKPDDKLAAKLEHALRIKLLVPAAQEKVPIRVASKQLSRGLTLGDIIQLDKNEGEAEERA